MPDSKKTKETYLQIFDVSNPEEKLHYMAVLDYLIKNDIDAPIVSKGNVRIIKFKGKTPPRFKDINVEIPLDQLAPFYMKDYYTPSFKP
jgi:hypothetical protein